MYPATKKVLQRIGFFVGVVTGGSYAMAGAPIVLAVVAGFIARFAYISLTKQMSHSFKNTQLNYSSLLYWILFLTSTGTAFFSGHFFFRDIAKYHDSLVVPMLVASISQGCTAGFVSLIVYWISQRKKSSYTAYTTPVEVTSSEEVTNLLAILKDRNQSSSDKALARAKIEKIGPSSSRFTIDIVKALEHENIRKTRYAISLVRALSKIGTEANQAVPYLIKILYNTRDSEIQDRIIWTLKSITQQDFGKDKHACLKWWEQNKANFGDGR